MNFFHTFWGRGVGSRVSAARLRVQGFGFWGFPGSRSSGSGSPPPGSQLFAFEAGAFLSGSPAMGTGAFSPLGGPFPKGPKYLCGTKYGFCSSNFPYGLGKYTPYGYLGPFGFM